jgi:hypothetical protein
MVPMRYLEPGEEGYVHGRTLLVELDGDVLGQIATLTVQRPPKKRDHQDNWVVPNGADCDGDVPSIWKNNAKFYEYLKHATGAKLNGAFVKRQFTIKEDLEDDGGWWKQHNPKNNASTEIPENLRFKYHDMGHD